MIYWELFLGFLKVGCFTFGGAYSAIPLIRDVVLGYGWLEEEMLTGMIAISESTPGPIMVNMATYIGSSQGGFFGAMLATFAVVLPSFAVILLIVCLLKDLLKNKYVQAVLQGLKPCVIGIILATGVCMALRHCFPLTPEAPADLTAILVSVCLIAVKLGWQRWKKKKFSPIALILTAAALGILFC